MITPNKFVSFRESVLSKLKHILEVEESILSISELYLITEAHFDEIDEFIYALDVLYVLDKIELDFYKGIIRKC